MTDRDLLELAAKAVGYKFIEYHIPVQDRNCKLSTTWTAPWAEIRKPGATLGNCWWNPLTNDGDALRLVAKLNLDINFYPRAEEVAAVQHRQNIGVYARSIERFRDDRCSATRRAIVRAAAEIGKSMP